MDAQDSFEEFLSGPGKAGTIGAEQVREGIGIGCPCGFQTATEQLTVFKSIVLRTRHC